MFSGLTNNREIGLRLGIRASHKGVDGSRHCRLSCNSNLPLLKTSSNFDRHFTETVCREVNYLTSSRIPTTPTCGVSMHVKQVVSLTVNQHGPLPFTKKSVNWQNRTVEKPGGCWAYLPVSDHNRWPLQGADLSEKRWFGFSYSSESTLPEAVTQKCMWRPCESGSFSYGESPRTPPFEGTSLHRRNNSVERPWGIFSLFTIGFRLRVNSEAVVTQTYMYVASLCEAGRFSYGESPRTPPLEGTSLHRRHNSVERPWGSWACLRPVSDYDWIHPSGGCSDRHIIMSSWSRSFFLRWITADPSPWGNFTPPTKQQI